MARSIVGALAVAALGLFAGSPAAQAAPADRDVKPVGLFVPFGTPVSGAWSALVRNDNGVAMTLHTSGLAAGSATTVWWVIFNNPSACTDTTSSGFGDLRCGACDLFNPAVHASVQYAAGHVIGGNGVGDFGSYLGEGNTGGCAASFLPCNGLIDSRTADVHLVVRTHGDAIPGLVDEQTSSFLGGCLAGEPNVGQCKNLQASPHESR